MSFEQESFSFDPEYQARLQNARRMARKMARRHNRQRQVRRLPRAEWLPPLRRFSRMEVPALALRQVLITHKPVVYFALMGMALAAFFYDTDVDHLEEIIRSATGVAQGLRELARV